MTGKQMVFCIVICVALVCFTVIVCVSTVVSANEREEQQFLVRAPVPPASPNPAAH